METQQTKIHPLAAYGARERLSQKELAKRVKTTQPTLSKWLSGRRKVGVENLPTIEKVTGISARVLRPDLAALFLPPWMQRRRKVAARAA